MCLSLGLDDGEESLDENDKADSQLCAPFICKATCTVLIDVLWRCIEESDAQTDFQALEAFRVVLDILMMQKDVSRSQQGASGSPYTLSTITYPKPPTECAIHFMIVV